MQLLKSGVQEMFVSVLRRVLPASDPLHRSVTVLLERGQPLLAFLLRDPDYLQLTASSNCATQSAVQACCDCLHDTQ